VTRPVVRYDRSAPTLEKELGSIYDLYDGDLVIGQLTDGEIWDHREPTAIDFANMFRKDGKAESLARVLTLPIRSANWTINPVEGRNDINDFVTDALTRPKTDGGMCTPMGQVLAQMTTAFWNRRAHFEKVYKRDGLKVVYDKIAFRPATTCNLIRDPQNGDLLGFKQEVLGVPERVDIRFPYSVVYVHGADRDPVLGKSDFDVVFQCYELKQKVKYLWYTYLEAQALPRTVVRGRGAVNTKKAVQVIAALKSNGVAGVPSDWIENLDFLQVSGSGAGEFRAALASLDSEAATSLLAGFTELGAAAKDGTGSFALSKDQSDFFLQLLGAYAKDLSSCATEQIIADLVRFNFGPGSPVPQFSVGPLNPDDINTSLDLLKTIAVAPQVNLPDAFIYDLVMQIGTFLGMDLVKLETSIAERKKKLEELAKTEQQAMLAGPSAAASTGVAAVTAALSGAGGT